MDGTGAIVVDVVDTVDVVVIVIVPVVIYYVCSMCCSVCCSVVCVCVGVCCVYVVCARRPIEAENLPRKGRKGRKEAGKGRK